MHNAGWKLVAIRMGMWYIFETCPPENVLYQLDFRPEKKEEQSVYEQMYRDYGWEHVTDCNHFGIFRKAGVGDTELYSDLNTKKAICRRHFQKALSPEFGYILFDFADLSYPQSNLGCSYFRYLLAPLDRTWPAFLSYNEDWKLGPQTDF